jgi:hypothetical protein
MVHYSVCAYNNDILDDEAHDKKFFDSGFLSLIMALLQMSPLSVHDIKKLF